MSLIFFSECPHTQHLLGDPTSGRIGPQYPLLVVKGDKKGHKSETLRSG